MCLPPAPLVGRRVRIHGLSGRPELNGLSGTATSYLSAKGRYAVAVAGHDSVLLKPSNLQEDAPKAPAGR